jgi:L-glyceraldehyde 3-phosphate reductase
VWDLTDELFDRLETISAEADAQGSTMVQYALRWTLDQPAVVSAIVGARRPEHIDEAVSVTG